MPRTHQTQFVQLNAHKCRGCWICIKKCPNEVIGKVGFLWHKHACIENPDSCTGCNQCIKACPFKAFSPVNAS